MKKVLEGKIYNTETAENEIYFGKGETGRPLDVTITNIDMPFWSMVRFMIQVAIAAIPALIAISVVVLAITFILGSIGFTIFSTPSRKISRLEEPLSIPISPGQSVLEALGLPDIHNEK
ncbi:hypothetical protein [uncultured Candidatus Kuenenia sp.]|jgi:hypothetical protein|uniref:hypothetical protein n=1 Tax=uncultured Candidatus Kuenenia sp. TaxID=1048336 RepID=UPI0002F9E1E0|nr:hypothetical protein [uncultured Candidatus Kuenenia sp.]